MIFSAGDIYYGYDAGLKTRHRLLVVSREELNRGDRVVTLLFTSAKLEARKTLPNCVFFPAGTQVELDKDCVVQAESIAQTYLEEIDTEAGLLGRVSEAKMAEVALAINYMLGD